MYNYLPVHLRHALQTDGLEVRTLQLSGARTPSCADNFEQLARSLELPRSPYLASSGTSSRGKHWFSPRL